MKVRPIGKFLLVRPRMMTDGRQPGVPIPEIRKDGLQEGEIVSVGRQVEEEPKTTQRKKILYCPLQKVLILIEEVPHFLVSEEDIIALLED